MNESADLSVMQDEITIRASVLEKCPLCGSGGDPLYQDLSDRLFGAPGKWSTRLCGNEGCRLIWLDPMPLEEEIHKAYLRYHTHDDSMQRTSFARRTLVRWISHGYLGARFGYNAQSLSLIQKCTGSLLVLHPILRERLDFRVKYLRAESCAKILDVGCGAGVWAKYMKDLGAAVQGIDFDPGAVRNAEMNGIAARLGSVEEANYDDERFDLVNMNHVIEHVPNPVETLVECARILKPGGFVAIATPNSKSLAHTLFGEHWRGLEPPRHLHLMEPGNLAQLVEKAGLKVVMNRSHRGTSATFRESYRAAKGRPIGNCYRNENLVEAIAVIAFVVLETMTSAFSRSRGQNIFLLAQKAAD